MRRPARAIKAPVAMLVAAILSAGAGVAVGAGQVGSLFGAGGARAATVSAIPALPRLGSVKTVDQNDVGDPYIVSVPPGVDPPTDVPFESTGFDAYQSYPWSAASAVSAKAHGWYVLFGTTDWQANVPTAISTDLIHWTQAPDALPLLPVWAVPSISMTWAPAALHTASGWVLYFSTEDKASKSECIGRAVATSPAGPYTDDSKGPLVCQPRQGGSIDPSVVRDRQGNEYLTWKNDGNSVRSPDDLWSEELTPDGLSLLGQAHQLLAGGPAWASGIVEAPAMLPATAGGYWLFYAGGVWNSDNYDTGLAYCASVTGPCAQTAVGPFLATTASLVSPAGLDTVTGPDGRVWAAFTALVLVPSPWHPGHSYFNRVLDIAPVLSH